MFGDTHEENTPLLGGDHEQTSSSSYQPILHNNNDDPHYHQILKKALHAIECGVYPERIYQGSSGSYFVKDVDGIVRLVSESFNYSPVDRAKARTKQHVATRFPELGRHFTWVGLPPKAGSFQIFVPRCRDAEYWLRRFDNESLPKTTSEEFQVQFEKLVILDYVIRNTAAHAPTQATSPDTENPDSHHPLDNLKMFGDTHEENTPLLGGDHEQTSSSSYQPILHNNNDDPHYHQILKKALHAIECGVYPERIYQGSSGSYFVKDVDGDTTDDWGLVKMPKIEVFAIDNGLAFPFKHPDEWRAYPFHWAWLPMAKRPFSETIKQTILPLISDTHFVNRLVDDLYDLFKIDPGFDTSTFEKQMSVLRGQIINLTAALRDSKSPHDLVRMPVLTLERHARRQRPRWPHQRLAAGLARQRRVSRSRTAHMSSNPDPSTLLPVDRPPLSSQQSPEDARSPQQPFEADFLSAGDLGTTSLNGSTLDQSLLHGLVALPISNQQRVSKPINEQGVAGDATDSTLLCDSSEHSDEERFKLQYRKKPFFRRF
ncbi:phosphatidylinositol 3- and 4-kinase, partial [Opisthorchis viverrini]